jgi:hypothetical protein
LEEFLAFYCTIACNEITIRANSSETVEDHFKLLCKAFFVKETLIAVEDTMRFTVAALVNEPKSGFNAYFRGYWNGDLKGLRITDEDITELSKIGFNRSNTGPTEDAWFALVVRNGRLFRETFKIPPIVVLTACEVIAKSEAEAFYWALRYELENQGF